MSIRRQNLQDKGFLHFNSGSLHMSNEFLPSPLQETLLCIEGWRQTDVVQYIMNVMNKKN